MVKLTLKRLSAEDEYPDLSQHNNYMAKVLTQDMYKKQREGYTQRLHHRWCHSDRG